MSGTDRKKLIEAKKAQVQHLYDEIAVLSDKARAKTTTNKIEKDSHTQGRLSRTRQAMHIAGTKNDRALRPSDRGNDIRTYSKMDLDVWKYDDVRNWFNQYATDMPSDTTTPAETGYMIRKE